jgi:hypothetical protein
MSLSESKKQRRNKLLEKKRKKNAKTKKAKLLRRRESIRAKSKYDKEIDKDVKSSLPKLEPIMSPEKKKMSVQKQLEENAKILKALEEQYEAEMASKREVNEGLEAQGHTSFKEKMDAMNAQAMENLKCLHNDPGGEFESELKKNWEMEEEAKKMLDADNVSDILKEAQESTAETLETMEKVTEKKLEKFEDMKKKTVRPQSLVDFFGGSATCTAKDKEGNILHTSGLDSKNKK